MENFFKNVPSYQFELLSCIMKKYRYAETKIGDISYQYLKGGSGKKAIVLLHGAMLEPYMWFYLINALENNYFIIAPWIKLPGIGAKESNALINHLLKENGYNSAIIMGYSYGGGLAQYYAECYPEKVSKLVLSHTGIIQKKDAIEKTEKLISKLKKMPNFIIPIIQFIRTKNGKESSWFNFRKAFFKWQFKDINIDKFISHFEKSKLFLQEVNNLPTNKISYDGPVIILGTESDKDTFYAINHHSKNYKNSKTYIFKEPGGHHMLFLYPDQYVTKVIDMLKK